MTANNNQQNDDVSNFVPNPQIEAVFDLVTRYDDDGGFELPVFMEVVTIKDGELVHISPETAGEKEIPYAVVEYRDDDLQVIVKDSNSRVATKWRNEGEGSDGTMMELGLKKAENELVTRNLNWEGE